MGGWLRHHPGDMGLTARATTQECAQIGKNGPSGLFWGICVHCCAVGLGCGWPWDRNSVHKWEDRASPHRIGAFVYTVVLRATRGARRWETGIISKHTSRETRYASIAVKATNNALAAIRPRMIAQAAGWARFIVQPMPKRLGRNKLASSRLR